MALEGTYEYECMRADLLGIEKPDYEEFMKNKAEVEEVQRAESEAEAKKEYEAQKANFGHTSEKLDELGNILKSTQRKINNITAPFSTFFKSKMSFAGSSKNNNAPQVDRTKLESDQDEYKEPEEKVDDFPKEFKYSSTMECKDKDLALDHIPLIDQLIDKCDDRVIGMEYQIKQMRKFK